MQGVAVNEAPLIADIDGDGKAEVFLAVANEIRVGSQIDGGQIGAWETIVVPAHDRVRLVAAGRVDGDLWPDLLLRGYTGTWQDEDYEIVTYLLPGSASVGLGDAIPFEEPTGQSTTLEEYRDVDGDGWLDAMGHGGYVVELMLNDGVGNFSDYVGLSISTDYPGPCVTDADGDGLTDIVGAVQEGSEAAFGVGAGEFNYAGVVHTGNWPICFASPPTAPPLVLYRTTWDESVQLVKTAWNPEAKQLENVEQWEWAGGGSLAWLVPDDFDGDGQVDLMLRARSTQLWRGSDEHSCRVSSPINLGFYVGHGDLDGDGDLEVVGLTTDADAGTSEIAVFWRGEP